MTDFKFDSSVKDIWDPYEGEEQDPRYDDPDYEAYNPTADDEARYIFKDLVESGKLRVDNAEHGKSMWLHFKFKYRNHKKQKEWESGGADILRGEEIDNPVFQSYSSENTTTTGEDWLLGAGATVGRAFGEVAALKEPLAYVTKPFHSPIDYVKEGLDTWLPKGEDGKRGIDIGLTLDAITERLGGSTDEMERVAKEVFQMNSVEFVRDIFGIEGDIGGTAELAGGWAGLGIAATGVIEGGAAKLAPKLFGAIKFSRLDPEEVIQAARLAGGDNMAAVDDLVATTQTRQDWEKINPVLRKVFGDEALEEGFEIAEVLLKLGKAKTVQEAWRGARLKINQKMVDQINEVTGLGLKDADELIKILKYGEDNVAKVDSEALKVLNEAVGPVAKSGEVIDDVTKPLGKAGQEAVDTVPIGKAVDTEATTAKFPPGAGPLGKPIPVKSVANGASQKLREVEMMAKALEEGSYAADNVLSTVEHYKRIRAALAGGTAKLSDLNQAVSGFMHAWARPIRHVLGDMGGIAKAMMLDFTKARAISDSTKAPIIKMLSGIKGMGLSDDTMDILRGMLDGLITVREARAGGVDEGLIRTYGLLRAQMDQMYKHFESLPLEAQEKVAPYIHDYFPHLFGKKDLSKYDNAILMDKDYGKVAQNLKKRWSDIKGYDEDLLDVLARYASDMSDEFAYREVWGKGMADLGIGDDLTEGGTVLGAILDAAKAGGHTEAQIQYMQKAFNAMAAYRPRDLNMAKMNYTMRAFRELEVTLKLPLSALRNLTQSSITAMVVDSGETAKALTKWIASSGGRKEITEFGEKMGTFADSMLYDMLQPGHKTFMSPVAGATLDLSQFNRVEQFNRAIAGWVGKQHAEGLAMNLVDMAHKSKRGTKEWDAAVRRLQEMNIDANVVLANGGKLNDAQQIAAGAWSVKSTQYSSRAEELSLAIHQGLNHPMFGDAINTFLFQFKSFPFKTVNTFYKNVFRNAERKGRAPASIVNAVFGLGAGIATTYVAKHTNRLVFGTEEFIRSEAGLWLPADPDKGHRVVYGEIAEAAANFLALDTFLGNMTPRAGQYLQDGQFGRMAADFLLAPMASDVVTILDDAFNAKKNFRQTIGELSPMLQRFKRDAKELGPNELKVKILQEWNSFNRAMWGYELD